MSVSIYIPSPFRSITGSKDYISAEGSTVEDILESIEDQYPGFSHLVFDEQHKLSLIHISEPTRRYAM